MEENCQPNRLWYVLAQCLFVQTTLGHSQSSDGIILSHSIQIKTHFIPAQHQTADRHSQMH